VPIVPIADGFGLNLQASLNPNSAFAKYFQSPPALSVIQQDLASLQDVPLAGFPLKSTEIGVNFAEPTALASTSPQFAGSVAASASLSVIAGGKLFDPDPFDSPIDVPSGHAYLGLGVKATLAPGVQMTSGKLDFGFAATSTLCLWNYKSFATTSTSPTFKAALQAGVQEYVIPLQLDDIAAMGVGDVATIEGTGSLQVSGTLNLLTAVNPLVSLSSSALPTTLSIKEGASVDVSACFKIQGDLQIRVQKVDAATARLGFYRKRGADLTVDVNPSVGVTAGTSSTDFISAILGTIGPSPFPSPADLEKAGLTKDKQETVVSALKAGVQRSLALAVQAELHALASQEAAFLYEVSLHELEPDGVNAIQDALRLNLSALSESAPSLPKGIREIQSVLTTTRSKAHTLKLNLLGIYNFDSTNDLTLKGTVLTDPASGAIVITDSASAKRIAGAVNYLANPDKLRKVLAQSFLITAAYRGSGLITHAPSLKVSYWHFAEHASTDRSTMADSLLVLERLGLISAAQEQQTLARTEAFGRSSFYVSTDYDDALSESLFLQSTGQPRGLDEYESIGRQALELLIVPGGDDSFRLQGLQDDAVWQKVKATGGTLVNLAQVFPGLDASSQIPVIAGDYVLIEWWGNAMFKLAQSLSVAKRFFSQQPPPAANSAPAKQVQAELWRQMAEVASNTHDRFSDPWGLLAMDLASRQQSEASAQIVSPGLTLSVERTKPSAPRS
jgi:hypothetical protein